MPSISVSVNVNVNTPDILGDIMAAVERHLIIEIKRLSSLTLRYWRQATPRVTGVLRASEFVRLRGGPGIEADYHLRREFPWRRLLRHGGLRGRDTSD